MSLAHIGPQPYPYHVKQSILDFLGLCILQRRSRLFLQHKKIVLLLRSRQNTGNSLGIMKLLQFVIKTQQNLFENAGDISPVIIS